MKHIKRKFSVRIPITDKILNIAKQHSPNIILTKIPDDRKAMIFSKDEMFEGFSFVDRINSKDCLVPEPDPILVYFNVAQANYRIIINTDGRKKMIDLLPGSASDIATVDLTKVMHSLYSYLGECSAFTIFLFMAMESAINKLIPDNYEHKVPEKKKTLVYNSYQSQQLEFTYKVNKILTEITQKHFGTDHPNEWRFLTNELLNFRNELVHTKRVRNQTLYKNLYEMAFNFDYQQAILNTRLFINYYHRNLVEECDCGADF